MDEGIVLHIWGILLETICAGETRVAAPVMPAELLASVVTRGTIAKHADCCISLSVIPQGARSVRIPARRAAAAEPHCLRRACGRHGGKTATAHVERPEGFSWGACE